MNVLKIAFKKQSLKSALIFASLVSVFTILFYFFWPFPVTSWTIGGTTFQFRDDLKAAASVPVSPSCETVYDIFNSGAVGNMTIHFKSDKSDYSIFGVETFELTYKISTFNLINQRNIGINVSEWASNDSEPVGTPTHPKIYLVGPASAKENVVEFNNKFVMRISGRNIQEMDRATIRAMMCLLGIKL